MEQVEARVPTMILINSRGFRLTGRKVGKVAKINLKPAQNDVAGS